MFEFLKREKKPKRQYIIPIFVPHLGCPNDCTFCNQTKISGEQKHVTAFDAKETIEYFLSILKDRDSYKEIAFFGGSFTGIDEKEQNSLLEVAYEYVKNGKVDSIRLSTRPDYIDRKTLKRLKKYKVKTIELGVQSTNDYILKKCKRGHTYQDVVNASNLIRKYGFNLGHQMMVGLPESNELDDINTAKDLIRLKPKMVRIYPVLVIRGTELEQQYKDGEYEPLTVNQAVERCKELTLLFEQHHVKVIRIGLQNTDSISNPDSEKSEVVAGPYHDSFRQLVESEIYYDKMVSEIKNLGTKVKEITIHVNPQTANNVIGYKRENINRLKELYDLNVKVDQDFEFPEEEFKIEITKNYKDFIDEEESLSKKKIK